MEEVDSIIIQQLRDLGCGFDETVTTLKDFDSDSVFHATFKCLSAIQDNNSLPNVKPNSGINMAAKYKLATQCASLCQEIGFKGDLGYQTFLYGSDAELRKLFLFLLERLPKDEIHGISPDAVGQNTLLARIKKIPLQLRWLPPMESCDKEEAYLWETVPFSVLPAELSDAYTSLRAIEELVRPKAVTTKDAEKSQASLAPADEVAVEHLTESSDKAEEQEEKPQDLELLIKNLDEKLSKLTAELEEVETTKLILSEKVVAKSEKLDNERSKLMKIQASNKTTNELKQEMEAIKADILKLGANWESASEPVINSIKGIKIQHKIRSNKTDTLNRELGEIRKNINNKLKEIKSKELAIEELKEKLSEQLPPNRASYTRRIIEIIGNVKKQNQETKKVLLETRQLQKEINSLSGKVQRSFTIADETIFKDAKSSEWNRKCYKLLATLHEDYDQLLEGVNAIGIIKREVLQLEEMVENERANKVVSNLTRIQADLNQMRIENQQIVMKYQSMQSR